MRSTNTLTMRGQTQHEYKTHNVMVERAQHEYNTGASTIQRCRSRAQCEYDLIDSVGNPLGKAYRFVKLIPLFSCSDLVVAAEVME